MSELSRGDSIVTQQVHSKKAFHLLLPVFMQQNIGNEFWGWCVIDATLVMFTQYISSRVFHTQCALYKFAKMLFALEIIEFFSVARRTLLKMQNNWIVKFLLLNHCAVNQYIDIALTEDNYNNGSGNLDWLTRSFWTTPTQPAQSNIAGEVLQAEELPQNITEEAQSASETDGRVKTKLMSMWNNVKYGLCEQSFYSFS